MNQHAETAALILALVWKCINVLMMDLSPILISPLALLVHKGWAVDGDKVDDIVTLINIAEAMLICS